MTEPWNGGGDYPVPGTPNYELIRLYTCRENWDLGIALKWCYEHGLVFDAVNENLPERVELHGNDCRKIGADMYIDDKARTPEMIIELVKRMNK